MDTLVEKRAYERYRFSADIEFSHFNRAYLCNAQIMNVGAGGMCIKSNFFPKPGAAICVRLKKIHSHGSCDGLHTVALAAVRWCSELPGENALPYSVGVKYFDPVY